MGQTCSRLLAAFHAELQEFRIGSLVGYSSYTKRDGGGERACQAGCPRHQTDPGGCSPLEIPHPKVSACVPKHSQLVCQG